MAADSLRPPTHSEDGRPDMSVIYDEIGISPLYRTDQFLEDTVLSAVISNFSDGEIVVPHMRSSSDPVFREHFGTADYNEGSFGRKLREMHEGDDEFLGRQAGSLIRYAANRFAHEVAQGMVMLPSPSITVDTKRATLNFDHTSVQLDDAPRGVIDYGPGLQGRFHIRCQVTDLMAGRTPYAYLSICKGPFINEFLRQYWSAVLQDNKDVLEDVLDTYYIGREDGIGSATNAIVESGIMSGSNRADIVIASGIHTAGEAEVNTGISNAFNMLRPNGVLLVRAPKAVNQETPDSVSAEAMVQMALDAGFEFSRAQFFDVITGSAFKDNVKSMSAVFRR